MARRHTNSLCIANAGSVHVGSCWDSDHQKAVLRFGATRRPHFSRVSWRPLDRLFRTLTPSLGVDGLALALSISTVCQLFAYTLILQNAVSGGLGEQKN